ncbi:MAG: metal-sensing transcriptional repressor, partial [Phycisphaeraceae bacterium]|nr:metal-sensing transcriptional repressor [Phycisphaeraceae bacterium]
DLLRRLKNVEGHVCGIQKMVRDDAYCIDVLKQIKAVRAALDRVGSIALETHLATCVTDRLRSEDSAERDRVIGEILEVFNADAKR